MLTDCSDPLVCSPRRRDELYQLWERILSEWKNTASLSLSCVNNPSSLWVSMSASCGQQSGGVCSYTWASPFFFASTPRRWAPHCLPMVLTGFLCLGNHQDASAHGEAARVCVHWAMTQASQSAYSASIKSLQLPVRWIILFGAVLFLLKNKAKQNKTLSSYFTDD